MDAGLGGEGAFADIGRVAIGRAVEDFVEAARRPCEVRKLVGVHTDVEAVRIVGFELRLRISETRLALPQRSPRPLSVPWMWRAPARTAASETATACSVSLWAWMPTWSPGTTAVTVR